MIYTSYFGNMKKITSQNPKMTFFSIAGKTPDWFENAKTILYQKLSYFAPKYYWWKEWHEKFKDDLNSAQSIEWYSEKYYNTVLSKIDPNFFLNDIKNRVVDNGDDICLLCYETPDKFCHRQLVKKWLNDNGIKCDEK